MNAFKPSNPSSFRSIDRRSIGAVVALVLLGAALRVAGMFDDLWLDEIWGWRIARDLEHVGDIFSRENRVHPNQPLNTFLLYIMGDRTWWPIYRAPYVLMGIATVALVALWTSRRSGPEMICATLAAAVSYPLVFYSSELRGYSAALFFMMLAIIALERLKSGWIWPVLFSLSVILGSLSHLLFLPLYAALGLWSLYLVRRLPFSLGILKLAAYHAAPALFMLWYFFSFVLGQQGSSTPGQLGQTLLATLALAAGRPTEGGEIAAIVMALLAVAGIIRLSARGSGWWLLFVLVIVVSPAMIIVRAALSNELELLTSRHLIASVMMLVLLLGLVAGQWWQQGGNYRWATVVVMGIFTVANLDQIIRFVNHGRGNYLAAVQTMAQQDAGWVMRVASDHPLRGGMVLQFYERFAGGKEFYFMPARRPGEPPADWLVIHAEIPDHGKAAVQAHFGGGDAYELIGVYPHYGLSGFTWELYRRVRRE